MDDIRGIILAAGESRRMDQLKLLLPWKEKTMIEEVIDQVFSSGIQRCLVVLGAHRDEILDAIREKGVKTCFNENYTEGMLSSVQCGIRTLPPEAGAVVIFLADQPMIPATVTKDIIQSYKKSRKGILIPTHQGRRGHPVLIDLKYREEIFKLDPERGLRMLPELFPDDVREVQVDEPAILRDIDTPDEYSQEKNSAYGRTDPI